MKLLATHITRYWYSEPVSTCHTEVHLAPRPRANQTLLEHSLTVNPAPDSMASREEQVLQEAAARETSAAFEAGQYVFESPLIQNSETFSAYARESFQAGRRFLDGVNDLSQRIFAEFKYDQRATTVSTPVGLVLESKRGVCQDFAHLMIACLRSLRLPARYVSGYVRSDRKFTGGDASHAWVSVWCPVFGWQDFDPTNNLMPQGDHLTVAWGRDYSDVPPVKGVALGGGEQVISVSVEVAPWTSE
jgi:transglutaminase-like putative cysteine protease